LSAEASVSEKIKIALFPKTLASADESAWRHNPEE
jgi:hypothetical protein